MPVIAVASEVESTETVPPAAREVHEPARRQAEPEASTVSQRAVEAPTPELGAHDVQPQADRPETARIDAAPSQTVGQEAARVQAEQLRETERQEAARIEAERVEAERREAAQLAAQRQEAQRRAAAQAEAERAHAERLEAERREEARIEAERVERQRRQAAQLAEQLREAQRQANARAEADRAQAERSEVERRKAARIEAERGEAERQDAARQAAQRQEAARTREEQEEDARREARRRAMARQLEEEAARREAAAAADAHGTLPLSLSTARRVRLWGRAHPDVELVQYAEAWALKIQQNTPVETARGIASRHHTPPLVTVAVRSDGSVESVSFELSSGAADIDDAIRRIVDAQRPYPAFPPALARRFDVIEIRRTWRFDTAVRLY